MKKRFYIARSIILTELVLLACILLFFYLDTQPDYLLWLDKLNMRSEHDSAITAFLYLGPIWLAICIYHFSFFILKKHLRFDSVGIFDGLSFRQFGMLPWDNITSVEIQVGKRGIGVMAIHLDKPVKGKHLIKIDFIGINRNDVMMLETSYSKVEESYSLGLF